MFCEVDDVLLKGAQNQNVSGSLNLAGQARNLKFFIEWPSDSTTGSVQIEEAYVSQGPDKSVNAYAGTWSPIGSAFTSPSSTQKQLTLTVVTQPFSAIRARVTATIDGSTGVTVRVLGN